MLYMEEVSSSDPPAAPGIFDPYRLDTIQAETYLADEVSSKQVMIYMVDFCFLNKFE